MGVCHGGVEREVALIRRRLFLGYIAQIGGALVVAACGKDMDMVPGDMKAGGMPDGADPCHYGPTYYGPYDPYKCASLTLRTPGPYGSPAKQWRQLRGEPNSKAAAPHGKEQSSGERILLSTLERLTDLRRRG